MAKPDSTGSAWNPGEGWDFEQINADADELRKVRAAGGVGAMLAHAFGIPAEAWRGNGGVDRPARKEP